MDPGQSDHERERAFGLTARKKWLRGIVYTDTYPPETIRNPNPRAKFITDWDQVGIIVQQNGPQDSPLVPKKVWVETGRVLVEDKIVEKDATPSTASPMSQR